MARRRNALAAALLTPLLASLLTLSASGAGAQARPGPTVANAAAADTTDPLSRALSAEDKGDPRTAAVAYRQVLQRALQPGATDGDRVALALLGLERVWAETGARDSILPVVARVLVQRPADPVGRAIQLRTLVSLGRDDEARVAFLTWRRAAGGDAAPVREYARLLLAAGRAAAADSLLADAGRAMGSAAALSGEVAQLHVALSRWNAAAVAFREALTDQPYLETAAMFALQRAPLPTRDSIRTVLLAPPVALAPRRLLSALELSWNEPRRAWAALSPVKSDDSTAAAWRAFGERAEFAGAWLVARDAWTAVLDRRGDLDAQAHAAAAALAAGDAAGALALARRAGPGGVADRVRALVPVEIAALGELGRAAEAQARLETVGGTVDDATRAALARPLVSGWLRAGDLARARAAVAGTDLADDDETAGWLALYDGDLATARKRLVRAETRRPELVDALGLLARLRLDRATAVGEAFLLLARRDSAGASMRFVGIADSAAALGAGGVGDAPAALLGLAARLVAPTDRAMALWERIVAQYPRSPEAPESLLLAARVQTARGDRTGAIARLETLIVEYPESALLPQARRELERLRTPVPPTPGSL